MNYRASKSCRRKISAQDTWNTAFWMMKNRSRWRIFWRDSMKRSKIPWSNVMNVRSTRNIKNSWNNKRRIKINSRNPLLRLKQLPLRILVRSVRLRERNHNILSNNNSNPPRNRSRKIKPAIHWSKSAQMARSKSKLNPQNEERELNGNGVTVTARTVWKSNEFIIFLVCFVLLFVKYVLFGRLF